MESISIGICIAMTLDLAREIDLIKAMSLAKGNKWSSPRSSNCNVVKRIVLDKLVDVRSNKSRAKRAPSLFSYSIALNK